MKSLVKCLLTTFALASVLVPGAPGAAAAGCVTLVGITSTGAHEGTDQSGRTLLAFAVEVTASTGCTPTGTVEWTTVDGSAKTADGDYEGGSGVIETTGPKVLTVAVKRDILPEDDETFAVVLHNPSAGVVIARGREVAIGTIRDDDGLVWGPPVAVIEGGKVCWVPSSCKIPVKISHTPNHPVTVRYATFDGTAIGGKDFVATKDGLLTFPAGKNVAVIEVQVLPDEVREDKEEFTVVIYDPSAGTLGNDTAVVTIVP